MAWVKELSLKLNFSNIYHKLKFLHTFPGLSLFNLGSWKFMISWRYNPNFMCLSILRLFTSQLLTEIKNIDMILKQLQKSNGSNGSKNMNYHVGWTIKRSLQLKFSCYIFLLRAATLSFLSSFNLTSCSAVASCITRR